MLTTDKKAPANLKNFTDFKNSLALLLNLRIAVFFKKTLAELSVNPISFLAFGAALATWSNFVAFSAL